MQKAERENAGRKEDKTNHALTDCITWGATFIGEDNAELDGHCWAAGKRGRSTWNSGELASSGQP